MIIDTCNRKNLKILKCLKTPNIKNSAKGISTCGIIVLTRKKTKLQLCLNVYILYIHTVYIILFLEQKIKKMIILKNNFLYLLFSWIPRHLFSK